VPVRSRALLAAGTGAITRAVLVGVAAAGLVVGLVAGLVAGAPAAVAQPAPYPAPVVTAPPDGLRGYPMWDSYFELAPFGYEEQEYLVSGTARDAQGTEAPYTTRIVVTRPSDPADFRGTVLLDWVNVTAQFENAVDTMLAREELLRGGYAYVHVSAQAAGLCCTPLTPQAWDPVRYADLDHPGDDFAEDIFTQVAQAFSAPRTDGGSLDPRGGLEVERVLAAGQSQSANRLSGYLRTWLPAHPEAVGVLDGFLVHGNVPGVKDFAGDAPVPVLHLLSDYEAVDDGVDPAAVGPRYRLWEVAGTAHADYWIGTQSILGHGPRVTAGAPKQTPEQLRATLEAAGNYGEQPSPLHAVCTAAGTAMPMRYATSAALHWLDGWAAGGAAPPNGPRYDFADGRLARDEHGNALGGIRLPPIDVPIARYESTSCQLGGITVPFLEPQVLALYPTHAEYLALMSERTDAAVAAGWLLPDDAVDQVRRACAAVNRWPGQEPDCPPYTPPAFARPLPSGTDGGGAGGGGAGSGGAGAPTPPAAPQDRPTTAARALPATGPSATPAALGLLLLSGTLVALRRRGRAQG
jgi:hypothetical protein